MDDTTRQREAQQDFIARGIAGSDEAKRLGDYIDADKVIAQLSEKLASKKAALHR